jgi:hypothetical protein
MYNKVTEDGSTDEVIIPVDKINFGIVHLYQRIHFDKDGYS